MNESSLETSTKVNSTNEVESTFIEETYSQDTSHGYCDLKHENHEVQFGLSSQLQVTGNATTGIPLQKNEAYGLGLVLENTQTPPFINLGLVSEPIISTAPMTTSDPHTTDSASKDEQISIYNGPQLHTAEQLNFCTTVENTRDHESDSEHQSYEQVCPYEKVQPCDVEHLLVQVREGQHHQTPFLHNEVSRKDCNEDNMDTTDSDDKTGTSPPESLNSYEQVWGYERIHHCDLPLEEFMGQKDDNTVSTVAVAKADDNSQ